jgi:tRNA(fMet)-specific endonuclease VapC
MRGRLNLAETFERIGNENCFISEITVAELRYGAEKSLDPVHSHQSLDAFLNHFTIVPIFYSIRRYAQEKVRLQKLGTLLHDEFDMLIGATAIENDFVLVTSNTKHFARFENIQLENWLTA